MSHFNHAQIKGGLILQILLLYSDIKPLSEQTHEIETTVWKFCFYIAAICIISQFCGHQSAICYP